MMTFESFTETLADSIDGLEASSLTPETVLSDMPQWDSLAILVTISECNISYGVNITAEELSGGLTASELHELVKAKIQ